MKFRDISKRVLGILLDSDNFLEAIKDQNIIAIRNLIEDEIQISEDRQNFTDIVKADLILLLWELGIDIHEAFPQNIIPQGYFRGAKVEKLKIPDYIEVIDSVAFKDCKSLEYLELPRNLNILRAGAFTDCSNIKHIIVPNTLTYVGISVFTFCENLEDIKFLGTIKEWKAKQRDNNSCIIIDDGCEEYVKVICTDGVCDFEGKAVK